MDNHTCKLDERERHLFRLTPMRDPDVNVLDSEIYLNVFDTVRANTWRGKDRGHPNK